MFSFHDREEIEPRILVRIAKYMGLKPRDLILEKILRIVPLHQQPSDYAYWNSRPVSERIDAIEILRSQYIQFKKDVKPGLQRVCRVIKQS